MGNYTPNSNIYNEQIYIYEETDLVLGGVDGASNIPLKQIADNSGYIKKFKGRIIHGTGEPDSNTLNDLSTDSNTINNILYLDDNTGSFWKPNDQNGTTWTNIYKSVIMNVKGLKINNNGNDDDYFYLSFNPTENRLEIKNELGQFADVRVGKVIYDTIDGSLTQSHFADQEILLLFDITNSTENTDAFFSVKRLEELTDLTITQVDVGDQSGETVDTWYIDIPSGSVISDYLSSNDYIQITEMDEDSGEIINNYYRINNINDVSGYITTYRSFKEVDGADKTTQSGKIFKDVSAIIQWDESESYWTLKKRDGTLLPINCAGFFINGVSSGFLADRVISTTAQFEELFSNCASGEDTCYLRKPETNYADIIENEFIAIKPNIDTIDGSYYLYNNVVILGNHIRIECIAGVFIKYGLSNISIKSKNDTNMLVDEYNSNVIEILSKNTYYESGENIGDQIILQATDKLFCFSDEPTINQKYTINSIIKQIKEDVNINSAPGTDWTYDNINVDDGSDFHTFEKNNVIWYAYITGGNDVYIKDYVYNSTTKTYNLGSTSIHLTATITGIENVRIFIDDTYMYIIANNASELRFKRLLMSSLANFALDEIPTGSSNYTNPKMIVDSGNVFITSIDGSNNLKCFKGVPSWTWTSSSNFDITNTTDYDINVSSTKVLITYSTGDETVNNLYISTGLKTSLSFTNTKLSDDITAQGYFSKMMWDGTNLYVFENFFSEKNSIHIGKVINYNTTPVFDSGNPIEILNIANARFDNFDIKINTDNKYPNDTTNIYQVIAFNIDITETNSIYSIFSIDLITWVNKGIILIENDNHGFIANINNDYIFMIYYNDSVSGGVYDSNSYMLKLYYNFEITLDTVIPVASITDVVASLDYKDNLNLKLKIDGQNDVTGISFNDIIDISNTINSECNFTLINCTSINGITFGKKSYNISLKTIIDNSNDNDNNISELNHSTVNEFNMILGTGTGANHFNDCKNINIIGHLDTLSNVGNGDFNS